MLKTLGAQIKEFKKDSLITPVFMILEVIMEMIIPLMMAAASAPKQDTAPSSSDVHSMKIYQEGAAQSRH